MLFIVHRVNDPVALETVDPQFGIELDIRDEGKQLICRHDPFGSGPLFEHICQKWAHQLMILNIKSERIEFSVKALLDKYHITQYFFLDSSMPMVVKMTNEGESKVALRYSEYESIDTIMRFAGRAQWVWIDAFESLLITRAEAALLKAAGFKLCLVSPELQGQPEKIAPYAQYLLKQEIALDGICCKLSNIDKWKQCYLVEIQTNFSDIISVSG